MRLSILCVRDYLSIFYIRIFHGSSVLTKPFSGRLFACGKTRIYLPTPPVMLVSVNSYEMPMESGPRIS